jgi:hypothetical protein
MGRTHAQDEYQDCNTLKTSCEYYLCVEAQKSCGDRGYLKSFGHNYCYKYENIITKNFSPKGKKWLKDVRECLIDELSKLDNNLTCREIKAQAFASHGPCYKKKKFCNLRKRDKYQLIKSLRREIKNPQILKAGIKIIRSCKWFPF